MGERGITVSGSSAMEAVETFKVRLPAGTLTRDLDPTLVAAIEKFKPLPFDAAKDALSWLRCQLRSPELPLLTVLDLTPRNELLAFCVLGFIPFRFAPDSDGDVPTDKLEIAVDVSWIARSSNSPVGFGTQLFEYAVSIGMDEEATAMVVTPHDDETAEKLWMRRFHFERAAPEDQPAGAPPRLWYPIREPPV